MGVASKVKKSRRRAAEDCRACGGSGKHVETTKVIRASGKTTWQRRTVPCPKGRRV